MNCLAGSEAQVRSHPIDVVCEYHTYNIFSLPSDDSDRGVEIVRGNLNHREPILELKQKVSFRWWRRRNAPRSLLSSRAKSQ